MGFTWGVASSSHQIEGGMDLDGGGRSIWDDFAAVPGAVRGGDTGADGVDHRRRWESDVDLMAALGVGAYRFSIAWPRVQPGGSGPVNERGLDFYRALVDRLLGRGITPVVTLYHWDLPSELEDLGGWPVRSTASRFAEYAGLVGAALGDRVAHWRTVNEPWCSAMLGYAAGIHAPGRRDRRAAVAAAHHLLLGHGLAVAALRSCVTAPGAEIGLTVNPYPVVPVSGSALDADMARRVDAIANRVWLDPVLRGAYPSDLVSDWASLGFSEVVHDGDLALIGAPIDALGLNYYRRHHVRHLPGGGRDAAQWPGTSDVDLVDPAGPATDGGWAIEPDGLTEALEMVAAYGPTPLYVEECGAAFDEPHDDALRVAFLRDHLHAAHRAVAAGVDLRGFFVWTWFDNFEWAEGYAHRFGLVHVDYDTYERTPKTSAKWFSDVMRTNDVP
ncbi:MAG TPA: GH1 family beta-glucosidase [Iamia sp.]